MATSQHPTLAFHAWQKQTVLVLIILLLIVGCTWLLPDYATSHDILLPPSTNHWLGTNDIGQGVLIGILTATPTTIAVALLSAFLSLCLSIMAGLVAAIGKPVIRGIILRCVDILLIIPSILFLLLVAAWIQPNLIGIICLLAIATWHEDVRVFYAVMQRELSRENVVYVRHAGGSWSYAVRHHILPAITPTIISLYIQKVRQAAMKAAGLAFLGLTDPRLVSWGGMMQDALEYLYTPAGIWLLLPPALSLTLFLFIVLLLGRSLEQHAIGKTRWSE